MEKERKVVWLVDGLPGGWGGGGWDYYCKILSVATVNSIILELAPLGILIFV